jgi:hypothetical protein
MPQPTTNNNKKGKKKKEVRRMVNNFITAMKYTNQILQKYM